MVQKSKGRRKKTRSLLRKRIRDKTPITKYIQEFKPGDKVVIKPEPSSHKGMPFKRFFGRSGTVIDKRGKSYIVKIKDGNKEKQIISRPEHLKGM
jgi:large subunit ribosomal protein L21e